jgi:hypothetical protein
VVPHAAQARAQVLIRGEVGERVAGDDDETEVTVQGERAHVAPDEGVAEATGLCLGAGRLQHGGRGIEADRLVPVARDRNLQASRAASELEHGSGTAAHVAGKLAVERLTGPGARDTVVQVASS